MIHSLLYVSRSTLSLPRQAGEVDAVVGVARTRNAQLNVTGALVFTERHWAQNLEGEEAALDELMASIRGDWRHTNLDVVYRQPIAARRFPTWTMAYAGPSTFVSGNVLQLTDPLPERSKRKPAERLIALMQQFVEAQLAEQRRNSSGDRPLDR